MTEFIRCAADLLRHSQSFRQPFTRCFIPRLTLVIISKTRHEVKQLRGGDWTIRGIVTDWQRPVERSGLNVSEMYTTAFLPIRSTLNLTIIHRLPFIQVREMKWPKEDDNKTKTKIRLARTSRQITYTHILVKNFVFAWDFSFPGSSNGQLGTPKSPSRHLRGHQPNETNWTTDSWLAEL